MELWLAATFSAALFQTWRTALQQRLRGQLSVNGAGVVRFLYGVPFGVLFLTAYCLATGQTPPAPTTGFLAACAAGGLAQIAGTNLLIMAFGYRNFAVGTAYSKTEAVQGAVLAWLLLGETISPLSVGGILVGLAGVLVLSLAGKGLNAAELARATVQPAALCGLGAGLGFAFSAVFIKAANQALPQVDLVLNALTGLVVMNAMQTVMQGSYMLLREPAQARLVFTTWRDSMWVGALSACGSASWFTAFAFAPVALVRAVGQVEMVFTLLFSRFYLKETLRPGDVAGLVLVVCGVVVVLLGR